MEMVKIGGLYFYKIWSIKHKEKPQVGKLVLGI